MAKYPNFTNSNWYANPRTTQFPVNQYVGSGSQIQGSANGGIVSLTETWQVGGTGSANQGNTNPPAGTDTLTMYGYTVVDLLGFGTSLGNGNGIARIVPAQHPILQNLWASKIGNVQGIGANGRTTTNVAAWKQIRFDVTWETPPYNIYTDAVLATVGNPAGSEVYRFVEPDYGSSVEFIQRQQGSYRFPQIAGGAGPLRNGAPIPGSGGNVQRLLRRKYMFMWRQVPDVGLFNGTGFWGGGSPVNIETALGCVNGDTFLGYAPGTLLFESWKLTARTYPLFNKGLTVPRCWDVQLNFNCFNPPTDPADPAQTTNRLIPGGGGQGGVIAAPLFNIKTGGHNSVPHPTNGYWYRAFQQGGTDTPLYWKYNYVCFATIFKMCA